MEYDEIWAVSAERIKAFFEEYGWEATVLPLPMKETGLLMFSQTRVIIRGDNAEEIHRQFVLHFISAGG